MVKKTKCISIVLVVSMLLFIGFSSFLLPIVHADNNEPPSQIESNMLISEFEEGSEGYGDYKSDKQRYYFIDHAYKTYEEWKDYEESGWLGKTWDLIKSSANPLSIASDALNGAINTAVNGVFFFNMLMTQILIKALDLAYSVDFVGSGIEKISSIVQGASGISNGKITSTGLFGKLATIISVVAVAYALYVFLWKRAILSSIGEILKVVFAFAISILLISNYSSFMNGVHNISNEISGAVLDIKVVGSKVEDSERSITARESVKNNIWSLFVDTPYLYLQYGTNDASKISVDRINKLLHMKAGSKRDVYVQEVEVGQYANNMMSRAGIPEKVAFTPLYLTTNALVSIPLIGIALLLIAFQFWFLVMASVAPFILLVGALPGQIGVIKRYLVELGLPFALKIALSFVSLILFFIVDIIYGFNFGSKVPFVGQFISIFALFLIVFILRKRLSSIFSSGSTAIRDLREELSENVTSPFKRGVQSVTTAGGAVVGGVVGGGAGAMAGANIGGVAGKALTGDADLTDLTSKVATESRYANLSDRVGKIKEDTSEMNKRNSDNENLENLEKQAPPPNNDGDAPTTEDIKVYEESYSDLNPVDKSTIDNSKQDDPNVGQSTPLSDLQKKKEFEKFYDNTREHQDDYRNIYKEGRAFDEVHKEVHPVTDGINNENINNQSVPEYKNLDKTHFYSNEEKLDTKNSVNKKEPIRSTTPKMTPLNSSDLDSLYQNEPPEIGYYDDKTETRESFRRNIGNEPMEVKELDKTQKEVNVDTKNVQAENDKTNLEQLTQQDQPIETNSGDGGNE